VCPGGAYDNSPAIHRWVTARPCMNGSPGGTTEQAGRGEGITGDRASPRVQPRFAAPLPACRAVSACRAPGKRTLTRPGAGRHPTRFSRPYGTRLLYNGAYPALKRWATFVASLPGRGRARPATGNPMQERQGQSSLRVPRRCVRLFYPGPHSGPYDGPHSGPYDGPHRA
jgi:hypothetical protein